MGRGRAVVIVGGGQAGLEVAASLRARGDDAALSIVGEEETLPYERPPLSKGLLSGELSEQDTALRPRPSSPSRRSSSTPAAARA